MREEIEKLKKSVRSLHCKVGDLETTEVTPTPVNEAEIFEQRRYLASNINMPVTTSGFVTEITQINEITVPNSGSYLCRVVLPFAGVSDSSWVIRVGVAVKSIGETVYTQHSSERLQTSVPNFNGIANFDKSINLEAGDKIIATVICNAEDPWNIASTSEGCYLDVRQLPTHTVADYSNGIGITSTQSDEILANTIHRLSSSNGSTSVDVHGYYGLLSDFYFGGNATETTIDLADINTWVDVELNVNANGLFDNRPTLMKSAQSNGHTGNGSNNNPIIFDLEGLTTTAFANFRASMAFEPEEDEGQLESRLLFNRHSGTTPSTDFSIEEVSLSMFNGADVDYVSEPMLSFFIGDTIDTNAPGDAGKCRFQIKSNVAGRVKLRALTWYINK